MASRAQTQGVQLGCKYSARARGHCPGRAARRDGPRRQLPTMAGVATWGWLRRDEANRARLTDRSPIMQSCGSPAPTRIESVQVSGHFRRLLLAPKRRSEPSETQWCVCGLSAGRQCASLRRKLRRVVVRAAEVKDWVDAALGVYGDDSSVFGATLYDSGVVAAGRDGASVGSGAGPAVAAHSFTLSFATGRYGMSRFLNGTWTAAVDAPEVPIGAAPWTVDAHSADGGAGCWPLAGAPDPTTPRPARRHGFRH